MWKQMNVLVAPAVKQHAWILDIKPLKTRQQNGLKELLNLLIIIEEGN